MIQPRKNETRIPEMMEERSETQENSGTANRNDPPEQGGVFWERSQLEKR